MWTVDSVYTSSLHVKIRLQETENFPAWVEAAVQSDRNRGREFGVKLSVVLLHTSQTLEGKWKVSQWLLQGDHGGWEC